jgi:curved DNA-binding protein CbpA
MTSADYYATLGVAQGAGIDEIRKAFRKKALQAHPDQGGSDKAFRELKEAFEYLIANASAAREEIGYSPHYDPFSDPDYFKHEFFAPENDNLAEFERSIRAQGCRICHGRGMISKLVDPSKGFMGREERFCSCQIVQ